MLHRFIPLSLLLLACQGGPESGPSHAAAGAPVADTVQTWGQGKSDQAATLRPVAESDAPTQGVTQSLRLFGGKVILQCPPATRQYPTGA